MLYDLAFLIFSLFYLPTLIFKGKMHADFAERFGSYTSDKRKALETAKGGIWIQAVSVGEVAACKGLINGLKGLYPDKKIVLSTITKAGNTLARKLYAKDAVIIYFPLDLSWIVRKVVALIRPAIYVMIETEIWPNVIKGIKNTGAYSIMVNGRISDRSFGKYKAAAIFLKSTMGRVDLFCMQSSVDAERIKTIGAPRDKVIVTGNMKLDAEPNTDEASIERLRSAIGIEPGARILVAGSIHPGEELVILETYSRLKKEFPDLRLILAPRHVEKFPYFESIVKDDFGFKSYLLSSPVPSASGESVVIVDAIGRLTDLYALAAVVFIGGSIVRHGGQNPVEAAILGKPVIFGPHMFNFRDISADLLRAGGAIEVKDAGEMTAVMRSMLMYDGKAREIGERARRMLIERRGATARNLNAICEILSTR